VSDDWVQMDPKSYSDPYARAPVYSSGPTEAPTVVPPGYTASGAVIAPAVAPPESQSDPALQASPSGLPPDDRPPEKGDLHIKERRSWKTWQLVTAVVVALVAGMAINGSTGSASGTTGSGSGGGYKLPPPSGSATTTTAGAGSSTSTTVASSAQSAPTTTAAGSSAASSASTTTTVAGGAASSPSTTVAVGPATVLVPSTQQTGNWTSPAFTIAGGTWDIGWAFQCAPAPTGAPAFQIFVVATGASPGSTPAVTSSAASGNSVTPQTTTGSQELVVQSTAACRWAVKVTGSGS
jgi:hypothetical protein